MRKELKEQAKTFGSEVYFLYPIDSDRCIKTKEQRKACVREKCSLWRGVDSDNLVWCNYWRIGDCGHWDSKYGKPYGKQFIPFETAEVLEKDKQRLKKLLAEVLNQACAYEEMMESKVVEQETKIQKLKVEKRNAEIERGEVSRIFAKQNEEIRELKEPIVYKITTDEGKKTTITVQSYEQIKNALVEVLQRESQLRGRIEAINKIVKEIPECDPNLCSKTGSCQLLEKACPEILKWVECLCVALNLSEKRGET